MRSFAIAPAMPPITIQPRMPYDSIFASPLFLFAHARAARRSVGQRAFAAQVPPLVEKL
jgi:hypothetical protein